jgi:flagellar basal-body rod protein FlgG
VLNGLYAAAAGMESAQYDLDGISNDVANADTPGYQAEEIGFHDLIYSTENADPTTALVGSGSAATITGYNQTQGSLQQTSDPLDVALQGTGYIEVRQADGKTGLTRNGSLELNSQGQITTTLGMPLVPPIAVPKGTQPSDINIASNGTVSVGGRAYGKLSVVNVTAPDELLPQGNSVYGITAASGPAKAAAGTTVTQGYLEQSNVDMTTEMTSLEQAQQVYSMNSKVIGLESQMGQIAATLH